MLSAPVSAAPPLPVNVAILVLRTDETGVATSEIYSAARNAIERNTVLDVAPFEVFSTAVRAEAIRECAGDGRCFAEKLRRTGAEVDLLLAISADQLDDAMLLGLRLVDSRLAQDGLRPDIAAIGEELPPGTSFEAALNRYLPRVFPPSLWGQIGTISVTANQGNAEVHVGARSCVTPCEMKRLRPGSYDVLVKKTDVGEWQTTVELRAGDVAHVEATIEEEPSIIESPVFWGVLGAGVLAAAGAVTFLLLRPEDPPGEICIAPDQALCQ